jgi:hypothetical protein
MSDRLGELPEAENADPDGVQMALRAAHTLWSRGDTSESLRWLRRAAETASDEGADIRSLQLAKAAAELRAKLFGSGEPVASHSDGASPAQAGDSDGAAAAPASSSGDERNGARDEAAAPASARPNGGAAPQYVVHRPREAPRQLMGLSPSTLETLQRDSGYPPSGTHTPEGERRAHSVPPPLPRKAVDEYEELDAEPDEDEDELEPIARVATLPPPAFQSHAYASQGDEPAQYADAAAGEPPSNGMDDAGERAPWDSEPRAPAWDALSSPSWDGEGHPSSWGAAAEHSALGPPSSDVAPARLNARIHHQAVRVALVPDPRAPGQYLVRALREGETVASGERVALLVALEPGQPLV